MAEVEAEDRTQAPSKLRQQQARERGQVAHSPELTGAAALLAAAMGLGVFGGPVASGLLDLVRETWAGELDIAMDLTSAVATLRGAAFAVLGPLAMLLIGPVAAGLLVHQAQVGGLWSPGVVAPDVARLWQGGRGLSARLGRGAWTLGKSLVVLAVAVWAIRSRVDGLARLGRLDTPALARAWADALRGLLATMATAALALGLVDYTLQRRRFDAMLRLTPEEAREDRKAMDGDPSLRGRRLRLARAWRGDAPELLAGATLVVVGPGNLAVILAGGPPPKRVAVRSAAQGPTGATLRRSAEAARIATVDRGDLATKLARLSTKPNGSLPPDLMADLAAIWPGP